MLRVAIVMNPISSERTASSTFDLIEVARVRGHQVWILHPPNICLYAGGLVQAWAQPVTSSNDPFRGYIDCGPTELLDLSKCDVLLMRLQPPFDLDYFSTCLILSSLETELITLNRPSAIVDYPEKLFMMRFPDIHPPSILSSNRERLTHFRNLHRDVVVKPLYDFQGSGVFHIPPDDENFDSVIDMLIRLYRTPVVVQKYIAAVREGDKRIFLLDGTPIGALNRIPEPRNARANLHAGGKPEAATLSERDMEICSRIGPTLVGLGLTFVGIDVIGGLVTEISTTSPTGLVPTRKLAGIDVSQAVWAWVELKCSAEKQLTKQKDDSS